MKNEEMPSAMILNFAGTFIWNSLSKIRLKIHTIKQNQAVLNPDVKLTGKNIPS